MIKKSLILGSVLLSTCAFAFSGNFWRGGDGSSHKGVSSIGTHIGGQGQADIDFVESCPDNTVNTGSECCPTDRVLNETTCCAEGLIPKDGKCGCTDGEYLDGTACTPCPDDQTEATSASSCQTCFDGYIKAGVCTTCPTDLTTLDSNAGACVACGGAAIVDSMNTWNYKCVANPCSSDQFYGLSHTDNLECVNCNADGSWTTQDTECTTKCPNRDGWHDECSYTPPPDCNANGYMRTTDENTCVLCPTDGLVVALNQGECHRCPNNLFTTNEGYCLACSYLNLGLYDVTKAECDRCPSREWLNGRCLLTCEANKIPPLVGNACVSCGNKTCTTKEGCHKCDTAAVKHFFKDDAPLENNCFPCNIQDEAPIVAKEECENCPNRVWDSGSGRCLPGS